MIHSPLNHFWQGTLLYLKARKLIYYLLRMLRAQPGSHTYLEPESLLSKILITSRKGNKQMSPLITSLQQVKNNNVPLVETASQRIKKLIVK